MKSKSTQFIGVNAPFDLYEWIKATAEKENRKVGPQVIQLIQEARELRECPPLKAGE